MIVSNRLPRGGETARMAKALAFGKGVLADAIAYAEMHNPDARSVVTRLKSIDAPLTTASGDWGTLSDVEFETFVAEAAVPGQFGAGRVPDLRRTDFTLPIAPQLEAALVLWCGEAQDKQVGTTAFDTVRLARLKLAAIIVLSNELVQATGTRSDAAVRDALRAGLVKALNAAFLDPANAGTPGEMPASIFDGITATSSSGDPEEDIATLIGGSVLDLADGVLVMTPADAARICLRLGTAAAGLTVRGGVLAGLPVLTSPAMAGYLGLVHASRILYAEGPIQLASAKDAAITMPDDPSRLYSFFQKNTTGVKIERDVNWQRASDDAVALVSGVDYGLGS